MLKQLNSNLLKVTAAVALTLTLYGCNNTPMPMQPDLPRTSWQTVDAVIGQDSQPPMSQWVGPDGVLKLNGKTIGIDEFGGNESGAPLASQTITRKLITLLKQLSGDEKFAIVDRSTLIKRKNELQMVNDNFSSMDDGKQAQMLGQAIAADYLLDGSVVEYNSDQKTLHLNKLIEPGEMQRYESDYKDYIDKLNKLIGELKFSPTDILVGSGVKAQQRSQYEAAKKEAVKPGVFLEENRIKSIQETRNIAAIGITARLIDVRTGEYVWLFQDEKRGFSLMDTMQTVGDELIDSMLKKTTQSKK